MIESRSKALFSSGPVTELRGQPPSADQAEDLQLLHGPGQLSQGCPGTVRTAMASKPAMTLLAQSEQPRQP